MILFGIITFILLILFLVALYNYYTAPVFHPSDFNNGGKSLISVLIPARNEEKSIRIAIESVIQQDYKNIEVIVGNDNSTDGTADIIEEYTGLYSNIEKMEIPALPEGWTGKNYTLHNVVCSANGEYFLFIDADVQLNKKAVSSAITYLKAAGADVLSVFPQQKMHTLGERLVVPLLNLFLLSILPLRKVYRSENVSLSAGIGQFILFTKTAYEKTGGHKEFSSKIVEDLELIRRAKEKKLKVLSMLDSGLISCRMYNSFTEAYKGFVKNFFPGSLLNPAAFLIFLSVYSSVLLLPFILIFFNVLYLVPLLLILTLRVLISLKSRQSIIEIILHPFQIIILFLIGLRSVFPGSSVQWKGRKL